LLVNIGVYIPEKLTKDERKIFEKLQDSESMKPSDSAKKSFFERFKSMFE